MPPLPPVIVPRFRWRRGALQPPGIWVDDGDVLTLRVSALASATGTVEARLRLLAPTLQVLDIRLAANIVAGVVTPLPAVGPLFQGFLQGGIISALTPDTIAVADAFVPGQIYAHLSIARGTPAAMYQHTLIACGYVTTRTPVGFPGGRSSAPREGPGQVIPVTIANPAAGAEWILTRSSSFWKLRALSFLLTTAGAAGNREVEVILTDTPGVVFLTGCNGLQPTGVVRRYSVAAPGVSGATSSNTFQMPWPTDMWLSPVAAVSSATIGLLATDQYSGILAEIEEWAG